MGLRIEIWGLFMYLFIFIVFLFQKDGLKLVFGPRDRKVELSGVSCTDFLDITKSHSSLFVLPFVLCVFVFITKISV